MRTLGSLLTNRSLLTAAASAALLAAPMFAQAPSSSKAPAGARSKDVAAVKSSSAIPRTGDGHPDLSGVYTNQTTVPMQRPDNCGAKEFYTQEDLAAGMGGARGCATAADAANGRGGRGGGRGGAGRGAAGRGAAAAAANDGEGPALAVHYDGNQFGLSGNTIPRTSSMRTSVITGPTGKLPATTAPLRSPWLGLRASDPLMLDRKVRDRACRKRLGAGMTRLPMRRCHWVRSPRRGFCSIRDCSASCIPT